MNQIIGMLIIVGLLILGSAIHLVWRTRLTTAQRTPRHNQLIRAAALVTGIASLGMLGGAAWLWTIVH
jgi:hypothetical protein